MSWRCYSKEGSRCRDRTKCGDIGRRIFGGSPRAVQWLTKSGRLEVAQENSPRPRESAVVSEGGESPMGAVWDRVLLAWRLTIDGLAKEQDILRSRRKDNAIGPAATVVLRYCYCK